MSRGLKPEERRLWSLVVATVRPAPGRVQPTASEPEDPKAPPMALAAPARLPPKPRTAYRPPEPIEPGRHRRIARGHDALDARLDLHGLDQDGARAALHGFLRRAQDDGHRAALVITGKGVQGDGVLKRRAPEWLSEPELRGIVAGFSPAQQHHGGEGALYVALKRRPR